MNCLSEHPHHASSSKGEEVLILIRAEGFGTLDYEGMRLVTETLQKLCGEDGRMTISWQATQEPWLVCGAGVPPAAYDTC